VRRRRWLGHRCSMRPGTRDGPRGGSGARGGGGTRLGDGVGSGAYNRVASRAGAGDGGDRAAGVLVGPAVGMLCLRMAEAHLVEC